MRYGGKNFARPIGKDDQWVDIDMYDLLEEMGRA